MSQLEDAVETMIQSLEQDHALENLANINKVALEFGTAGNPAAAQRLLERALATYVSHYAANTIDCSVLMHNLALQFEAQNDFEAARKLFTRALELREHRLGHDSLELLGCLDALGRLSVKLDRWNDNSLVARHASLSAHSRSARKFNICKRLVKPQIACFSWPRHMTI